jgi:uncharacterized protein
MKKVIAAVVLALSIPAAHVFAADAVPNEKAVVAAKELMSAMNMRAMMQASMQQMAQHMPDMMRQMAEAGFEGKKLNAEQKRKARAEMDKSLPGMLAAMNKMLNDPKLHEELEAETVAIYARHFTEDEMHQVSAFYKSPVGAKMLASMPQLMQESMLASQKVIMPRIAKMVEGMSASAAK